LSVHELFDRAAFADFKKVKVVAEVTLVIESKVTGAVLG